MEDFRRKGYSIQNNTSEEIEYNYNYLVKKYYNKFVQQITEIVQSELLGIPDYRIAEWTENYLLPELKTYGRKLSSKINEILINLYNSMNNNNNLNKSPSVLIEEYQNYLNEIEKRINSDWLEDAVIQLKKEILKKLEYYYDPFNGVLESTNKNFYNSLDNISYGFNSTLRRQTENFNQDCIEIVKNAFSKNIIQINQILEKRNKSSLLQEYEIFAQIFGYKFEQFNDTIVASKKDETQVKKLRYNQNNNFLADNSSTLLFQKRKNIHICINQETDKLILFIPNKAISISNIEQNEKVEISKNGNQYIFFNNSKPTTNIEEIYNIINIVKKEAPGYYDMLINDLEFMPIAVKARKYEIYEIEKYKAKK